MYYGIILNRITVPRILTRLLEVPYHMNLHFKVEHLKNYSILWCLILPKWWATTNEIVSSPIETLSTSVGAQSLFANGHAPTERFHLKHLPRFLQCHQTWEAIPHTPWFASENRPRAPKRKCHLNQPLELSGVSSLLVSGRVSVTQIQCNEKRSDSMLSFCFLIY